MISKWALLADDITGACDSAAEFARCGFEVCFWLNTGHPLPSGTTFLALSSNSREGDDSTARESVASLCRVLHEAGFRLLLKKVDSALRGHWLAEVEAAALACGRSEVLISPTLPAFGRFLKDGKVCLPPETNLEEVDALAALRETFGDRAVSMTLAELRAGTWRAAMRAPRFVLVDSESGQDLSALAEYALRSAPDSLLAGSAGLAAALAAQFGTDAGVGGGPSPTGGKAVYWVGSVHPASLRQVERLLDEVEPVRRDVVPVEFRPDEDRHIRFAAERAIGSTAFVVTGGETATLVLRALGADGIGLRGLVQPGIPWGVLVGGPFDGLTVVTKSGSFGGPDTLVRVDRFLFEK